MAQTTTSAFQQQVNSPAVDVRQAIAVPVALEGVRTSSDLAVTQRAAGANMSVDIAPGSADIQDDHAGGGGFYPYTLSATTNLAVGTADPTNPRIDRVVIRVRDQALGDAANDAGPVVLAGTPTAGATLNNQNGIATLPGSSLLIANILVPAASSSVTTANIDTTGAQNNTIRVRGLINQWSYTEFTSNVTATATTAATAAPVVTAPLMTFDGNAITVEFSAPFVSHSVSGAAVALNLYEDTTDRGILAQVSATAAGAGAPVRQSRRLTPSAGSHTYSIKVWSGTGATTTVSAGAGGPGTFLPGYIKITTPT